MDYVPEYKEEFKKFKVNRSLRENIEPEEIFLDAKNSPDFFEQKLETPLRSRIFFIFLGIILLGLSVLIFRTGLFQIFRSEAYVKLAQRNSVRSYPIVAPRGIIYDRNLKPLVNNMPSYDVFLTPQDLPKDKMERDTMVEQISYLLDISPKDVNDELDKFDFEKAQRILLISDLAPEKILEMESKAEIFPALTVEQGVVRQYLYGPVLANILGYTGKLTQDELAAYPDYFVSERLGKDGLEADYEKFLRGQLGERQVEVDAKGKQIKELGVEKEIAGQSIVTTIDFDLQKEIYDAAIKVVKDLKLKKAAIVAMDPQNGAILSLVSLPSFDNNIFERGATENELQKIWNDPDQPLFNRAISGQYPSGSTIKPLLGAAALEENVVTPNTVVNDTGPIVIVNQYNPGIVYTYPDWKVHGLVNIYSAIAESCDVYFYTIGGGHGDISGLGIDRIAKYLKLFGLGSTLGIDLPGEKNGLVPDPGWKEKIKDEQWFIGDTYHVSIGQGDLLVTPLQMASAISAIANGGMLYQPHLVDKIVDSDKNSINVFNPKVINKDFIKPENLAVIRKGMRQAVTAGSARSLASLPVEVTGKTGTAQIAGQKKENAWFVSFAPYENPKIVLAIMYEDAGEGSSVAVPLAKEIYQWYFNK